MRGLECNRGLNTLHLGFVAMDDDGVERLVAALWTNRSLQRLHVTMNAISDRGATRLLDLLTTNRTMTALCLGKNTKISSGKLQLIRIALARNLALKVFFSSLFFFTFDSFLFFVSRVQAFCFPRLRRAEIGCKKLESRSARELRTAAAP